ncbi:hypothetical protein SAMN05216584_102159 [Selenomonas sp. WCT3]|uniref:hypothetical protein n=1 Tax=unclassified Selenomonas TaxID=2637378 RepID=UPI0008847544|nr:hypothetical protein [Selenomonas sp.]MCR5440142.1 hypothetical protein [Selenomonas sp.]SDG12753.1 hypothetical protein SAMN05216584_102159 [Selenomonas ruminantium]
MKEVLSIFIKRLSWGLAALTLMLGSLLLARGEGGLIGGLLLGYMAALVFVWNMAWRLWRIAEAPTGGATKQMLWGLVLRMAVLLLVLLTAINISAKVFGVTALGFLLCYGMAMFLLIHMNLR